ncbi:conserved hypothetical protein [Rippkaea orientalis PCC 8801]|uniref:Lipoprotein n=1 Tax=Rippkaea orientalis (strain PCC 8801 / RF-1) TaxID=41431 RepID=B7K4R7_RIPO1|nr:hypothetical protein [Rippkaea orientalis]ACK66573.1 conserved hypothetical protein [Rippkaea orientalis PCC 8801]
MKTQSLISLLLTFAAISFIQSCGNNNPTQSDNQTTTKPSETTTETVPVVNPEPSLAPLAKFDKAKAERLTNTAKTIAGMKIDDNSKLAELQKTQAWNNYRNSLENSWSKLETQQLSKVRQWSGKELPSINDNSSTVFYPFSGPDFLYAYSLFPKAQEYVLVALEPVGKLPDFETLSTNQQIQKLQESQNALYAILKFSFFRTNDMKVDMTKQGVLPVLFLFLARTNNQILDLQYVGINSQANIQKFANSMIPGVKINFLPQGESTPRTLYYFSTDLSDAGLKKTPQFSQFVKQLETPVTYLKASSYLMHYGTFSNIRELILSKTTSLVQDDSGIALKYFNPEQWDLKFFGNYTPPRAPFNQEEYQPNLMQVYRSNKNISKIDFGIGYNFGPNESNLMIAIPKAKT